MKHRLITAGEYHTVGAIQTHQPHGCIPLVCLM